MKILITTDWYKPAVNGVVTSVLNLEEGLKNDGHDVRILTLSNNIHHRIEGNVYYFNSLSAERIYTQARFLVPARNEMLEELIAWKPDVIHSQTEFSTFIMAMIISKHTDAPIVHTYHTVYEDYTHYFCPSKRVGEQLVKYFSKIISRRTTAMIVPSGKVSDILDGYKVATPTYVIPSGIDIDYYTRNRDEVRRSIRDKYDIDQDEKILVYVGRLAKEKNLEQIVEYLSDERAGGIRILVVGDGPDRDLLEHKIDECNMRDRVILTGMVEPEQVADYYKAGDIFVNASTSETQGLTYMEAMSSGLPVLCREDECLKNVIEPGVNGFMFADREDFLEKLRLLMSDDELCRTIGENATKSMIEQFSIESFTHSCERVYEHSINEESDRESGNGDSTELLKAEDYPTASPELIEEFNRRLKELLKYRDEGQKLLARQISAKEKIEEQYEIVEALSRDYKNIYKVDLDTEQIQVIKAEGYAFDNPDASDSGQCVYRSMCEKYAADRIYGDDRESFLESVELENVRKRLVTDSEYTGSYRAVINGEIGYYQFKFIRLADGNGQKVIVGFKNIDRMVAEAREKEQLRVLSETDLMTGLYNRGCGEMKAAEALQNDSKCMLLIMDIDKFKNINDAYGHTVGDKAIVGVAHCLKKAFRAEDIVFRLGGDEFAVMAHDIENKEQGEKIIRRFFDILDDMEIRELGGYQITVSVGAVLADEGSNEDFENLYKKADSCVYLSKRQKGNALNFHIRKKEEIQA